MSNAPIDMRNEKMAAKVIKELEERHFEAYYAKTKEEALERAISLIDKKETISWGGSFSIAEIGLLEKIKKENYNVIDRDVAKTPEERAAIARTALLCDTYLTSTNAMTEKGELVNMDGNGNRVAAMIYGPKKVIMIVGVNKIVHSLEDAISRTRHIAAPINTQRFPNKKTPCIVTGECGDCKSLDSICSFLSVIRLSNPPKRIKIIIVGENLGF